MCLATSCPVALSPHQFSDMNGHILSDNLQEEALLANIMRFAGIKIDVSHSLDEALDKWNDHPVDIVLIALRTTNPVATVRETRRNMLGPIMSIVDAVSEDTHVELIEAGADWVTQRPYSPRLLIAYTKALLRRSSEIPRHTLPLVMHDAVRLNPGTRSVTVGDGNPQRLSQLEFRLLHTLMVHQGQILPTETLVEHVWGYGDDGDRGLVRGLINRLRVKIEPNPNNPQYIRTIPRVGYTFGLDTE